VVIQRVYISKFVTNLVKFSVLGLHTFITAPLVDSSMPNITLIGASCRPCGTKNLKITPLTELNTGAIALHSAGGNRRYLNQHFWVRPKPVFGFKMSSQK